MNQIKIPFGTGEATILFHVNEDGEILIDEFLVGGVDISEELFGMYTIFKFIPSNLVVKSQAIVENVLEGIITKYRDKFEKTTNEEYNNS